VQIGPEPALRQTRRIDAIEIVHKLKPRNMDVTMSGAQLSVSERAARRIAQILQAEPEGSMLRISVEGGGCSGFQYRFDFDRVRQPDDVAVEHDGATVLVDETSLQFMGGAELDYVEDLIGSAFKIRNPNAVAACGCGTSFTV